MFHSGKFSASGECVEFILRIYFMIYGATNSDLRTDKLLQTDCFLNRKPSALLKFATTTEASLAVSLGMSQKLDVTKIEY